MGRGRGKCRPGASHVSGVRWMRVTQARGALSEHRHSCAPSFSCLMLDLGPVAEPRASLGLGRMLGQSPVGWGWLRLARS
eukprot:scaffold1410_cov148-Isochrysis_galbana.AAC.2